MTAAAGRESQAGSRIDYRAALTRLDGLGRAPLACQEILEREGLASRIVPGRQGRPGRAARPAGARQAKPGRSRAVVVLAWRLAVLGLVAAAAVWWFARPGRTPTGGDERKRPPGFARRASDQGRVWVEPEGSGPGRARLAGGFMAAGHRLITSSRVAGEVGERVRVDGRTWGRVAAVDEWLGVAVVDLAEATGKALPLGESGGLQMGERLLLPGTAAAEGLVVRYPSRFLGLAFIELDAQVAETDSGGPVLGAAGEVVGVLQRYPGVDGPRTLVLPVEYLVTGPEALLSGGRPSPSEAWQRVLERADLGSERQPELLAADLERPILLWARLVRGQAFQVGLALPSARAPQGEEMEFALTRGVETLCTVRGQVAMWQPISREEGVVDLPAAVRWLERHGQPLYLYSAGLELSLAGCDLKRLRGSELVVRGGLAGADRCKVEDRSQRIRSSAERRRSRG